MQMRSQYDVRFALEEDVLPHIQPWLDQVDNPPEEDLHPSPELNPNNSGCLVTRIKTKQVVRRQEHALLAVEALCVMSALKGRPYPTEALKRIRQDQYFTQFHDAITATHIDAAYAELEEIWASIDRETGAVREQVLASLSAPARDTLSVINPTGQVITGICSATLPAQSAALVDGAGHSVPMLSCEPAGQDEVKIEFVAELSLALLFPPVSNHPWERGNQPDGTALQAGHRKRALSRHGRRARAVGNS